MCLNSEIVMSYLTCNLKYSISEKTKIQCI